MIAILTALAPIFIITALGYVLVQIKAAGPDVWHALDHITFYLLFPALLAKTLVRADLGSVPASDFILVVIGSVTIAAAALIGLYLFFRRPIPGPAFTSFFQGAIRFQSTICVAISAALFGERGLTFAALAVACMIPTIQFYTVLVLLIFGAGNHGKLLPILQRLALNPLALGCLVGLILNRTGLPNFAFDTLNLLGSASIGLTLLSVGAGLNLAGIGAARGLVALSLVVRLLCMPLLVFAMSSLAGLTGLARTIAVIAAAVPTAPTAYTMARKMGGDAELMAQIITFQSVAAALTLPLFIYLSQAQ
jgi:predicted permease